MVFSLIGDHGACSTGRSNEHAFTVSYNFRSSRRLRLHDRFDRCERAVNPRSIGLIAILFAHKFVRLINYRIPPENQLASRERERVRRPLRSNAKKRRMRGKRERESLTAGSPSAQGEMINGERDRERLANSIAASQGRAALYAPSSSTRGGTIDRPFPEGRGRRVIRRRHPPRNGVIST